MATQASRSAGFSLTEVLVALAIAVLFTAVLTRLVINTRMSAAKIRELVEMMTLGDTLLEQQTSQQIPKTSDGRSQRLAWHIDVVPMAISAVARRVNLPTTDQTGAKTAGLAAAPDFTQSSDSFRNSTEPATDHGPQLVPFHVTIVVESPTGRKYVADTVSLGPPAKP